MFGQNYLDTSLWIHESGHIFDRQHGGNGDYSATSAWLNAYNSDSHLPTGYANTSKPCPLLSLESFENECTD